MKSKQLNIQQEEAKKYIEAPLLVLAGAGSGKTSVITEKIAYLIQECQYSPYNILAVTFTNKAAKEMKERVINRLQGVNTRGLNISTFHTLGMNILKKDIIHIGYKSNFTLFDDQDSSALINDLAYNISQITKEQTKEIKNQISLWKNSLVSPYDQPNFITESQKISFKIYQEYSRHLKAYNAIDFDDLIFLVIKLFQSNKEILLKWQNRFRYLLIDEYQDTNISQYHLIKLLIGTRGKFTVVGDDDQSIYSWRGAQPENLRVLKDDFSNLKVIKLEQNYRSSGRILKAANILISNNPHLFTKKLWSNLGLGSHIKVHTCANEQSEASFICSEIISNKFQNQSNYGDYAILYRGNHQSFLIEKQLQLNRIPYFISSGGSFFSKSEVKDIIAYLRLINNSQDDRAFLRIINTPRREIGPVTLECLGDYAMKRNKPMFTAINEFGLKEYLKNTQIKKLHIFTTLIHKYQRMISNSTELKKNLLEFIEEIHYKQWLIDSSSSLKQAEKRFENVETLINFIINATTKSNKSNNVLTFNDIINRLIIIDLIDNKEDQDYNQRVQLLTLHAAKGLEYKNVYLIGMEEGIIPHQQSIDENQIEEERRLAYVGITRAKENLTLTLCRSRSKFKETFFPEPSRFISELPTNDIEWSGKLSGLSADEIKKTGKKNISNLRALLNRDYSG